MQSIYHCCWHTVKAPPVLADDKISPSLLLHSFPFCLYRGLDPWCYSADLRYSSRAPLFLPSLPTSLLLNLLPNFSEPQFHLQSGGIKKYYSCIYFKNQRANLRRVPNTRPATGSLKKKKRILEKVKNGGFSPLESRFSQLHLLWQPKGRKGVS